MTWDSHEQNDAGYGVFGRRQRFHPDGLAVDVHGIGTSDLNGVLEPGEAAVVEPHWTNEGGGIHGLNGNTAEVTGPAGPTYTLLDGTAAYGDILFGVQTDCNARRTATRSRSAGHGPRRTGTPNSRRTSTSEDRRSGSFTWATASRTCRAPSLSTRRSRRFCTTASRPAATRRSTVRRPPSRATRCPSSSPRASSASGELVPDDRPRRRLRVRLLPRGPFPLHRRVPDRLLLQARSLSGRAERDARMQRRRSTVPGQTITRDAMASFIAKAIVAPGGGTARAGQLHRPDTARSYSCISGSAEPPFHRRPGLERLLQAHPLPVGQGDRGRLHGDEVLSFEPRRPRRHGQIHRERIRSAALRAVDSPARLSSHRRSLIASAALPLSRRRSRLRRRRSAANSRSNTYTTGKQVTSAIAATGDRGFVVVWQSDIRTETGAASSGSDSNGSGMRVPGRVPGQLVNGRQSGECRDRIGSRRDFVVVWQSAPGGADPSSHIFGQRFHRSPVTGWAKAGPEFQISFDTTNLQFVPSVGMDASANFVVVWESAARIDYAISGQRFNASGAPIGAAFPVPTLRRRKSLASEACDEGLGRLRRRLVSTNRRVGGVRCRAAVRRLRRQARNAEFAINTYTTGNQRSPSVGMDAGGNFVVAWQDDSEDGSNTGIVAQRFNSGGEKAGGEFVVNSFTTQRAAGPRPSRSSPSGSSS